MNESTERQRAQMIEDREAAREAAQRRWADQAEDQDAEERAGRASLLASDQLLPRAGEIGSPP